MRYGANGGILRPKPLQQSSCEAKQLNRYESYEYDHRETLLVISRAINRFALEDTSNKKKSV